MDQLPHSIIVINDKTALYGMQQHAEYISL